MTVIRNHVVKEAFNKEAVLPYELRLQDFDSAIQDVYDFFFDVNSRLVEKGLDRLDEMLRPAIMSGVLSDMITASLAKHSRVLVENRYFNGHPDLIVKASIATTVSRRENSASKSKRREKLVERLILTAHAINGCAYLCTQSTISLNRPPIGILFALRKST